MFARSVSMKLKTNDAAEFTRTINDEVIPLLRKQKGFLEEIVLAVPGKTEVLGISLWDRKESAETYNRDTYPQVQKALAKVLDGTPLVKTYDVTNSTFHKAAAHASA